MFLKWSFFIVTVCPLSFVTYLRIEYENSHVFLSVLGLWSRRPMRIVTRNSLTGKLLSLSLAD